MKYFYQVAEGVDVAPILHCIAVRPELWNQETVRTAHAGSAHKAVDDILLRFNDLEAYKSSGDAASIMDGLETINFPPMFRLPQVRPVIFDLMRKVEGERLGRVIITRLLRGSQITKHIDQGAYAAYYSRYHLMLQNSPGSVFMCGDETCYMAPGTVWWFDTSVEHGVVNNSTIERITLIVDIRVFR